MDAHLQIYPMARFVGTMGSLRVAVKVQQDGLIAIEEPPRIVVTAMSPDEATMLQGCLLAAAKWSRENIPS